MHINPSLPLRRLPIAALAVLLVATALGLPALAQDAHRSFRASVTAGAEIVAGSTTEVTVTLQNTSTGPHQLGSADITLPSGLALFGGGTVVQLRNLSLAPGASEGFPFTVLAPCTTGTYDLGVQAKQANNFRGNPGNDLQLLGDAPSVTVVGSCGALTFLTQPKDAEVHEVITGRLGDPDGPEIEVQLAGDGTGVSDVPITITLRTNGAVAELRCKADEKPTPSCTKATGATGIAHFPELEVTGIGRGFTLEASSVGITPVASDAFSIWEDIERCEAGRSCSVTQHRSKQLTATVSGVGPAGAGANDDNVLLMSLLPVTAVDCSGGDPAYPWNHAPATVLFDLKGEFDTHKVATLLIDKAEVRRVTNNGASFYQVCFEAEATEGHEHSAADPDPNAFVPRDGGSATLGPALLADCLPPPNPNDGPCVASRTKTRGGDMQVVIHLPPKDPMFR